MCGRVWQSITGADMRRLFSVDLPAGFRPRYNLAPTQDLLLVCEDGGRQARLARWGLIASLDQTKGLSTFNARLETAQHSPVFREAYRTRRAVIPIQGAYEWTGEKGKRSPLAITRTDSRPMVCAGLWNELDGQVSCTILTTDPTGVFAEVHDRMPLLLPQDRWAAWLDPGTSPTELARLTRPRMTSTEPCTPTQWTRPSAMSATTGRSSPGRWESESCPCPRIRFLTYLPVRI